MRPSSRRPVNKARSLKKFRKGASRTKVVNTSRYVMRGGLRM